MLLALKSQFSLQIFFIREYAIGLYLLDVTVEMVSLEGK